ncbi:MAG: thioesterase family protein [Alphaproteobacteria bacterium]|jgi:acyl-CoA thioesterase FadM|nr:thioesterase family protein [Alphaproteobacteria bacterium]MDP6815509.1 thioesterase family protein [Alphaproteobacteria bacterium]
MADWMETYRGAVLGGEYDAESHMNTAIYVSRFDQATWFLLSSVGITPALMRQRGRRIAMVRQAAQYLRELRGGQLLTVESGFVAVGRKHLRFQHRMFDVESRALVASSDCTAVQASLKTGRSVVMPAGQRQAAEGLLVTANVAGATGLD